MGGWVRKRAGPSFCTCNNVGGPKTNPKKKQIAGAGAGGGGACMMVQGGVQGFFLQLQCTGIFASIA